MSIHQISTTILLTNWEKGSSDAERLCADLLRIDAFENIDPQQPLGGPDGGKDILCTKDEKTFVAAVYFPREPVSITAISNKFSLDLQASLKHNRSGFIFLTNQHLTVGERTELERIAAANGKRCLIYHRERLRVMLDTPAGYGLRLRHLHIPMSNEEQTAFFAASGQNFTDELKAQTRAIESLAYRIDQFRQQGQEFFLQTVAVIASAVRNEHTDVQAMLAAAAAASFQRAVEDPREAVSAHLTPSLLRYVHRLILSSDLAYAGKFRETQVWLVDANGEPSPGPERPAWDRVPSLIRELLDQWNRDFSSLLEDNNRAITSIARFFQQLLWIHPFVDGNTRLAQAILALQARELLGLLADPILDRGTAYYIALQEADTGNLTALEDLIKSAVRDAR
ncbi:Fic family protein [Acetobacter sp. UBA5411]|uniref:Fic family protein n=1 Tax=Acetobacter sp. UBA5411 TaxID=1945905 RepID=UPI0025BACAD9|nr:Fic family protein [Acetobacter sp. UBA5411]